MHCFFVCQHEGVQFDAHFHHRESHVTNYDFMFEYQLASYMEYSGGLYKYIVDYSNQLETVIHFSCDYAWIKQNLQNPSWFILPSTNRLSWLASLTQAVFALVAWMYRQ